MRPMDMERYLVFRMPEVTVDDEAWYLVWDGNAESVTDALNTAAYHHALPEGSFEYRIVQWDDIAARPVRVAVERTVEIGDPIGAAA